MGENAANPQVEIGLKGVGNGSVIGKLSGAAAFSVGGGGMNSVWPTKRL